MDTSRGVVLSVLLAVVHSSTWPKCVPGFDLMGGDLHDGHLPASTAAACEQLCTARDNCTAYSYHAAACSDHGEQCPFAEGCCRLKEAGDMDPTGDLGMHPNNNKCSCSALIRIPAAALPMPAIPAKGDTKNVLYLLFDGILLHNSWLLLYCAHTDSLGLG